MTVLHPVVGPATNFLLIAIAELIHRSAVGAQAIGGDGFYRTMALQRLPDEGKRCLLVAGFSDVTLENFALLVNRATDNASLHRS